MAEEARVAGGDLPDTEDFSVDMSKAKTFQPLPEKIPYLIAVSNWAYGKTQNGRKVDYELTVLEPEAHKNRKVPESVSLENEFTLGRYQTILMGLGFSEDYVKSPTHKPPKPDEVKGLQACVWFRTRKSDTYGDRSVLARIKPVSVYTEAAQAAQAASF